jgi:hypothetical protein
MTRHVEILSSSRRRRGPHVAFLAAVIAAWTAGTVPLAADSAPPPPLRFNHHRLEVSVPAKDPGREQLVLEVADGGYFTVRIEETDPRLFTYTVTGIPEDPKKGQPAQWKPGASVVTKEGDLRTVLLTMRHSRLFRQYRVEVAATAPAGEDALTDRVTTKMFDADRALTWAERRMVQEEKDKLRAAGVVTLYSVSFDIWVETKQEWTLTVNGGVAFSNLTGEKFFIETDTKGTADPADDTQTVQRDKDAEDDFRPDVVVLAHLGYERWHGFGPVFGFGIGENSEARYFLGAALPLGRQFIFSAGWSGGRVDTLPAGQVLGAEPVAGANTLSSLGTRFANGFYVGLSFGFVDRRDAFDGVFKAEAKVEPAEAPEDEPKPEEPE